VSHPELNGVVVVEWAPNKVRAFDAQSGRWKSGDSVASVVAPGSSVVIAPSRRVTYLKSVRVPNVPPSEVRQILNLQLNQLLPISASDAATDFRLTNDVTSEGRLAVVCAVKSELLDQIEREAKDAGAQIKRVVPAAFGSALLAKERGLRDCAVLEYTPDGLALDLIADGELRYSRLAPDVSSEHEIANELKRTFAVAGTSTDQILAAGGLPAREATQSSELGSAEMLAHVNADALGISLVAPHVIAAREAKARSSKARLAVFSTLAAALIWIVVFLQYADASRKLSEISAKQQIALQSATAIKNAEQSKLNASLQKQQIVERAFHPAQPAADVASVVSNCVPSGVWLTGLIFEKGKPLQIRGSALSSQQVTEFMQRLGNSGRFRDVKLAFMNNAGSNAFNTVQFSATAHVIGNLPLVDKTAGGTR